MVRHDRVVRLLFEMDAERGAVLDRGVEFKLLSRER